jgi:iron complex outermembrane receptor protein
MPCGCALIDTQMPQAPHWSLNGSIRYEWTTTRGRWAAGVDAKWETAQYFELINAPVDLEPAHIVTNARLGYTSPQGDWDVIFGVRNLTDRRYRVYNLDLSATLGSDQSVFAPPRLWNVMVAYHWGK